MSLGDIASSPLLYILLAGLVFVAFVIAARFVAQQVAEALRRHGLRENVVVVGSRVITVALIVVGALFAFGIAVRSDNVTILGIVAAIVITSFGAQDLLKDYVSGYYILLERNIKLGDNISLERGSGVVSEVRLRVTLLRNENGDIVIVPNSELFTHPVTIHAHPAPGPDSSPESEATPAPRA
ncbi:MAG TPA: mechanosensitive ion channel domain-containing protein [Candidatus Acidoferrum sp.]|jgi:small-conductance mechanosensitive channel|nr:mechanosensitive ion channel domain-containing protein [Candidatus Acidoferrum sp.]